MLALGGAREEKAKQEAEAARPTKKQAAAPRASAWRKGSKAAKQKVVYKTLAELTAEEAAAVSTAWPVVCCVRVRRCL
jgi:hypothetical protein